MIFSKNETTILFKTKVNRADELVNNVLSGISNQQSKGWVVQLGIDPVTAGSGPG
jgi:hypothetical protein